MEKEKPLNEVMRKCDSCGCDYFMEVTWLNTDKTVARFTCPSCKRSYEVDFAAEQRIDKYEKIFDSIRKNFKNKKYLSKDYQDLDNISKAVKRTSSYYKLASDMKETIIENRNKSGKRCKKIRRIQEIISYLLIIIMVVFSLDLVLYASGKSFININYDFLFYNILNFFGVTGKNANTISYIYFGLTILIIIGLMFFCIKKVFLEKKESEFYYTKYRKHPLVLSCILSTLLLIFLLCQVTFPSILGQKDKVIYEQAQFVSNIKYIDENNEEDVSNLIEFIDSNYYVSKKEKEKLIKTFNVYKEIKECESNPNSSRIQQVYTSFNELSIEEQNMIGNKMIITNLYNDLNIYSYIDEIDEIIKNNQNDVKKLHEYIVKYNEFTDEEKEIISNFDELNRHAATALAQLIKQINSKTDVTNQSFDDILLLYDDVKSQAVSNEYKEIEDVVSFNSFKMIDNSTYTIIKSNLEGNSEFIKKYISDKIKNLYGIYEKIEDCEKNKSATKIEETYNLVNKLSIEEQNMLGNKNTIFKLYSDQMFYKYNDEINELIIQNESNLRTLHDCIVKYDDLDEQQKTIITNYEKLIKHSYTVLVQLIDHINAKTNTTNPSFEDIVLLYNDVKSLASTDEFKEIEDVMTINSCVKMDSSNAKIIQSAIVNNSLFLNLYSDSKISDIKYVMNIINSDSSFDINTILVLFSVSDFLKNTSSEFDASKTIKEIPNVDSIFLYLKNETNKTVGDINIGKNIKNFALIGTGVDSEDPFNLSINVLDRDATALHLYLDDFYMISNNGIEHGCIYSKYDYDLNITTNNKCIIKNTSLNSSSNASSVGKSVCPTIDARDISISIIEDSTLEIYGANGKTGTNNQMGQNGGDVIHCNSINAEGRIKLIGGNGGTGGFGTSDGWSTGTGKKGGNGGNCVVYSQDCTLGQGVICAPGKGGTGGQGQEGAMWTPGTTGPTGENGVASKKIS